MENQSDSDLEVLPSYMIPRIVFGDSVPPYLLYIPSGNPSSDAYNTLEWPGPDLNINVQNIPEEIVVITMVVDGINSGFVYFTADGWSGDFSVLETGVTYRFSVTVDEFYWDAIQSLAKLYNLFNNQTLVWPVQDLEINADNIPSTILQIQRDDGVTAAWAFDQNEYQWVGNLLNDGLEEGKTYTFVLFDINLEGIYWPILPEIEIEPDKIIYNGISPIKEELGKGIGDCNLTNVKYYNEPKSIWELFGFEGTLNEQDTQDTEAVSYTHLTLPTTPYV